MARLASTCATVVSGLIALVTIAMIAGTLTGKMRVLPVLSGSMTPAFDTGSAAIVTPQAVSALRVGQVVVYHIPVTDHHLVMHRVVKVKHGPRGGAVITTRGDANPVDDPWKAQLKSGVVWVAGGDIPFAGYLIVALRSPFTIVGIGLLVAATIAGMVALREWRERDDDIWWQT